MVNFKLNLRISNIDYLEIYSWNDLMKYVFGRVNQPPYPNKKKDLQSIRKKLSRSKISPVIHDRQFNIEIKK